MAQIVKGERCVDGKMSTEYDYDRECEMIDEDDNLNNKEVIKNGI